VNQRSLLIVAIVGAVVWLLVRNHTITQTTLLLLVGLIPSIILHEVSHGVVALAFGDDTAKQAGRITLNPAKHIDPFGTVLLPALLVISGAPAFGYAKPVPVNPRRLRNPRQQSLLVSLAGPVTNLLLVGIATVVLRTFKPTGTFGRAVLLFGVVNVVLAVFNLIPIPPLDGSAVLERFMPRSWWPAYLRLRQYSMLIVLGVFLLKPGLFGDIIDPALRFWVTHLHLTRFIF
jgi:Zn-dependent protease